ncbi:MAG: hypothetical protein GY820_21520 [Gammaproteobacteria bacterium]|nr:hypothetical protein [Gammaproteobacteria bacterium]
MESFVASLCARPFSFVTASFPFLLSTISCLCSVHVFFSFARCHLHFFAYLNFSSSSVAATGGSEDEDNDDDHALGHFLPASKHSKVLSNNGKSGVGLKRKIAHKRMATGSISRKQKKQKLAGKKRRLADEREDQNFAEMGIISPTLKTAFSAAIGGFVCQFFLFLLLCILLVATSCQGSKQWDSWDEQCAVSFYRSIGR